MTMHKRFWLHMPLGREELANEQYAIDLANELHKQDGQFYAVEDRAILNGGKVRDSFIYHTAGNKPKWWYREDTWNEEG